MVDDVVILTMVAAAADGPTGSSAGVVAAISATAAIAGGLVTAFGSYLVTKNQLRSEEREAERKRAELAREERKEFYLKLIAACVRLQTLLPIKHHLTRADVNAWFDDFSAAATGAQILGTERVRASARALYEQVEPIPVAIRKNADDALVRKVLEGEWTPDKKQKFQVERDRLLEAIRADIATSVLQAHVPARTGPEAGERDRR